MSARDALAAIRERLNHEPCCDHSGQDEHGCWDCRNTGCAHPPYADGQAAKDLGALVGALEAVLDLLDEREAAARYGVAVHAPDNGHRECIDADRLDEAIETALEGR